MIFDEWIISVFDRPVRQPHGEQSFDWWDGPDAAILGYMTRLFAEAEIVLAPFSDAQAAQGLWAMCSQDISNYPLLLTATSLPLSSHVACIEAMDALFGRFFALRCSSHLSHLDKAVTPASVSPLNGVCYMWWDVLPLGGLERQEWPAIQSAIVSVFRHCLENDAVACQESALLGLMNWSGFFDETSEIKEFEEIANRVLSQDTGAWPALAKFQE